MFFTALLFIHTVIAISGVAFFVLFTVNKNKSLTGWYIASFIGIIFSGIGLAIIAESSVLLLCKNIALYSLFYVTGGYYIHTRSETTVSPKVS